MMRYEFRLRLMEMLRLERDAEWEDSKARAGFWALLFAIGAMPLVQFFKYLDGNYDPRDMLMWGLAAIAFCTVRFVYLTVRRLRHIRRGYGSVWSSPVCVLDFLPEALEFTYGGRVYSFQWEVVELFEKRGFCGFRFHKSQMCPFPKRVIPPDELPKLTAFLAERIPPKTACPGTFSP